MFTGGLGLDFGARKLGAMAVPMSAGNTQRQLMCMEDFGATASCMYAIICPYILREAIARDGQEWLIDLQLKVGIQWSRALDRRDAPVRLRTLLTCRHVLIFTDLCEITGPGVALDCKQHKGIACATRTIFYPEVLKSVTDHTPCRRRRDLGELVFTTLSKGRYAAYLRYRTKDLTSIDHSTCECGRTTTENFINSQDVQMI